MATIGSLAEASAQAIRQPETASPPIASAPDSLPFMPEDKAIELDALLVGTKADTDTYDPTGMGAAEAELNEPPFSNDLLAGGAGEDEMAVEINTEVQLATGVTPAELAAGVTRVNLKGFPAPRLRNGFTQNGVPEVLNVGGMEMIQGPLTPVTGRAAPGGIQNFVTARPRGRALSRFESVASRGYRRVAFENSGTFLPKKLWQRWAIGWQERKGPEAHAFNRTQTVNGSLVYRHSRGASTMLQIDYQDIDANSAPGVPEYRLSRNSPILGPYRPLAYFHGYGPNAGLRKRLASASLQFEGQLGKRFSVRAGTQWFHRELDEERWTLGQFLLDTGKFGGTREPQHVEQPLTAVASQIDVTARVFAFGADHKILASVESSRSRYTREQRGLETAERNQLPADVRTFDPFAPNFYRPGYDPLYFRRIITDRHEATDYTGLVLSERAAFAQGRLVATIGGRLDQVKLELADDRPGTTRPQVEDAVDELTWHAGANYQLVKSRLLVFANTSTAFEPSTRVDARTGRIQGNETTIGYETGAKGLFLDRRLTATALVFAFTNENISRRNPLYNDPILDPNLTQPELVAAGEERFTGGTLDLKGRLSAAWSVSGRFTYTDAVTTKSPDLPEEEGRALTRVPPITLGLQARYELGTGPMAGLWASLQATYLDGFVAQYASDTRAYLAYPGYTLFGLNSGYAFKRGRYRHAVSVSVRNLFDRDLLALLARPGAGRDFGANYTLSF